MSFSLNVQFLVDTGSLPVGGHLKLCLDNVLLSKLFSRMKTLEEAAHKVNSLLVRAAHPRVPGDQDANPAETTSDVAVPSSEEKSDDTDIATSAPNKPDTDVDNDDIDEVDALLGKVTYKFDNIMKDHQHNSSNSVKLKEIWQVFPKLFDCES